MHYWGCIIAQDVKEFEIRNSYLQASFDHYCKMLHGRYCILVCRLAIAWPCVASFNSLGKEVIIEHEFVDVDGWNSD